jgi:hypothetical protein
MAGPNMKNRRQALEEASYLVSMRTELPADTAIVLSVAEVFETWLNRDEETGGPADDFTYFAADWGTYRVYPDGRVEYLEKHPPQWVPSTVITGGWTHIKERVRKGDLTETFNPPQV